MPGSDWQNPLFVHEGRAKQPELSSRVRAVVGVLGVPRAWDPPVILTTIYMFVPVVYIELVGSDYLRGA